MAPGWPPARRPVRVANQPHPGVAMLPPGTGLTASILCDIYRSQHRDRGAGMGGGLKDRVEAEANRLLRERLERLRQTFDEALSSTSEPLRFPLTPGEWGAASGAAQLHVIRDAID